jgi:O-antigen ligase
LAYFWRFTFLISATVVFIYVSNSWNATLSFRFAVAAMTYWFMISCMGIFGIANPLLYFESPMTALVPEWLEENRFVRNAIIIRRYAAIDSTGVPRPRAGFPYANTWGSTFALLVPFVGIAYVMAKHLWQKGLIAAMLALSALPLVFSLNRGAWLSLSVGVVYAMAFALREKHLEVAWSAMIATLMIVGMVLLTPLQAAMTADLDGKSGSNTTRLTLYKKTVTASLEAPFFGHGTPQPRLGDDKPSAGTHGHVWLVLISQGYPGLIFFLGWLAYLAHSTRNPATPAACWYHVVVLIGGMQIFFYELTGAGLIIMFIAGALALREQGSPETESRCIT